MNSNINTISRSDAESTVRRTHVIVTSTTGVGIALLLTIFFGPPGLFHATVRGALTLILGLPAIFTVFLALGAVIGSANPIGGLGTIGLSFLLLAASHPISIVWSMLATNACNKALAAGI
jgi:hypothetical protein